MNFVLNEKSKHILKNNLQNVIRNKQEMTDNMIIKKCMKDIHTIIYMNILMPNDIINIILEYINDIVVIVDYKTHKIGDIVYVDVSLNNQILLSNNHNFSCNILCAKDGKTAVKSIWFERNNKNNVVEYHSVFTQGISFFNYFMYNVHNEKYFLKCGSVDYYREWYMDKYNQKYKCYAYDMSVKVLSEDKMTNIIRIIKTIIHTINDIIYNA